MIPIGLNSGGVIRYDEKAKTWDIKDLTAHDIAVGLSRTPRFGGQTRCTYSVAEHSVLLFRLTKDPWTLWHDSAEGLGFGDLNTFIKSALKLHAYTKAEDVLLAAIAAKFKVPKSDDYKTYDKALGALESDAMFGNRELCSVDLYESARKLIGRVDFPCWDEHTARREWLRDWEVWSAKQHA